MDESQEILKIEILDEEETPAKAEDGRLNSLKENVGQWGKAGATAVAGAATQAAQKGWDSEARKTVTGTVKKGAQKGATAVAAKSAELMHEHLVKAAEEQARQQATQMQTRLRETDWKAEAGKGATVSLRWASRQVGNIANRLSGDTAPSDQKDESP